MKRDLYGSAISAGVVTRRGDGSVHYDTNIVCKTTYDNGVSQVGSHGRYAKFSDTRTRPLVGNTDDYSISLVRASITTNEIPLYVALPIRLVTENSVSMWEVDIEPGLSYTWTGPVYNANSVPVGPVTNVDWLYAAWPTYGWMSVYQETTAPGSTGAAYYSSFGLVDCSVLSTGSDTLATIVASRLTFLFNNAPGVTSVNVLVTAPTAAPSNAMTQQFSITNNNTLASFYIDFSLTSPVLGNHSVGTVTQPTKAGLLQACKYFGFVPGQVFEVKPLTTVLFPRAYQLGFRSTLNLYTYKKVRWVPEDTGVPVPTQADVDNNAVTTYFDCYSYQHLLNQCINPTFTRCIFDQYDKTTILSERCLQRQLDTCCYANAAAVSSWNSSTTYTAQTTANPTTANACVYQGIAYVCLVTNSGNVPSTSPTFWLSCGASINYSYVDGKIYSIDDVVTIRDGSSNTYYATATVTPTTGPPLAGVGSQNGWSSVLGWTGGLRVSNASVATLPPSIGFNPSTNLFTLNLDSYGFGGTTSVNADDGYYGVIDDLANPPTTLQYLSNATLNDIARDSWGITGANLITTVPYTVARRPGLSFDERLSIEVDDGFHQLFGNWPCLRLYYFDPVTSLTTAYIRYIPQASQAGLSVNTPLPLTSINPSTTGLAATYLPYGRIGGTVPYFYTFAQDLPSIGEMWNPVDAIIVATGNVPIEPDQTVPAYVLGDSGEPQSAQTNGNTLKILAEINYKPLSNTQVGQEYRNEILFDPQTPVVMDLQSGRVFNQFDYQLFLRMKATGTYRPLSLSNRGNANLRWVFQRK